MPLVYLIKKIKKYNNIYKETFERQKIKENEYEK